MDRERRLTLKTAAGRKWLLGIAILIVFLSGFFARLINSEGGKIKIEVFNIDARGATINGELMYPAGASSDNKLPCVIIQHGTGCTYGVMRHFAIELARRGFVAMVPSCYGAGLSEQPLYDELGHGKDIVSNTYGNTTSGMLDCINYAQSLAFVDDTRIGITGHSMGSRITQSTAVAVCGFYSYNDIMINVLCDTFGQTFTKDEIDMDAAKLAAKRLSPEQLTYYNYLAKENRTTYDKKVKAAFPMGNAMAIITKLETVKVGGYDVKRGCQVNLGLLNGAYDYASAAFYTKDYAKATWYTGSKNIAMDKWYTVNDAAGTSKILGDFGGISITNNTELAAAVQNRSARIYTISPETHSMNFFSIQTTASMIKFFEQTLNYSNGNLTDGAVPMSATNQIWYWGRIFNLTALLGMVFMMFPLLAMIVNLKFYAPCVGTVFDQTVPLNKNKYWIFGALAVVFTFFACYIGNQNVVIASNSYLSLSMLSGGVIYFILIIAGLTLAALIVNCLLTRKAAGSFGLTSLNLNMKIGGVLKGFLIAGILILAGYVSLLISEYLFNEDYRFFMAIITEMKVDYWWTAVKYALILIVPYLAIGAGVNYTVRTDIPEWRETLNTVVVNSLGIWILCGITEIIARVGNSTALFSNFVVSYQLCLFVPITVYISRKMYNITKNLWIGAVFNSLLIAWSMTSELGSHTAYFGQNWLSIFFNV